MHSIRSYCIYSSSTRTNLRTQCIHSTIHCFLGMPASYSKNSSNWSSIFARSRYSHLFRNLIWCNIYQKLWMVYFTSWVIPIRKFEKRNLVDYFHERKIWWSYTVDFSCEILFSEFLSILKTTQVQPDMFEDMTRILIQNSQSSGKQDWLFSWSDIFQGSFMRSLFISYHYATFDYYQTGW